MQLLLDHSTDEKLKRLFTMEAESAFKKKLLTDSLKKLLSTGAEKNIHEKKVAENSVQSVKKAHLGWPESEDQVLTALRLQWKPLFSELNNLSARLYDISKAGIEDVAKRNEAGAMAHRILDLDDECDEYYAKRDYYLEHKRLPDDRNQEPAIVDPLKLPILLHNAQRYVREFKLKVKNNPSNEKAAAKLLKWEQKVVELKRQLKID